MRCPAGPSGDAELSQYPLSRSRRPNEGAASRSSSERGVNCCHCQRTQAGPPDPGNLLQQNLLSGDQRQADERIQATTAAGICTVLDLLANGRLPQQGLICQEQIKLPEFLANRFGALYASASAAPRSSETLSCNALVRLVDRSVGNWPASAGSPLSIKPGGFALPKRGFVASTRPTPKAPASEPNTFSVAGLITGRCNSVFPSLLVCSCC